MAAWGIVATAAVLPASSAFDLQPGLPTFLAGIATAVVVLLRSRCGPMIVAKTISWGVLPLGAWSFLKLGGLVMPPALLLVVFGALLSSAVYKP